MKQILLIANEVIGARMAGPGIRAWEIARVLAGWDGGQAFRVTLAVPPHVPRAGSPPELPFAAQLLLPDEDGLRAAVAAADAVFTQGFVLQQYPWLPETARALALDIYDPFVLEGLDQYGGVPESKQWEMHELARTALNAQLMAGDYFVCASERQRDYWLGMLTALGRVNPATHREDPALQRLIGVAPFGLPAEPLRHTHQALKGVWPGIGASDRVILWHGGIWNWLDPTTLVRAMVHVRARHPEARLFFMGARHPNPKTPYEVSAGAREVRALAAQLGLLDRQVFFNEWVDYADRESFLLEADVSAMTYGDHVETRFAFRTRMLDAIAAGLPVVCTRGDALAELVEQHGLGYTVAAGDVLGLADAIARLLDEPDARGARAAAFREVAAGLTWERVVEPLAAYLADPRPAPDRGRGAQGLNAG
jgi:glycosyltransferase involved in cell wall biosynthesis